MGEQVEEIPLGGAITAAVRVGMTVRRPAGPGSAAVAALLRHLESAGFDGAPRYLGLDDQGRATLTWIDGWCPSQSRGEDQLVPDAAVRAVGALLRRFHDAVDGYDPAAGFEAGPRSRAPGQVVCHGDIAPRNTIFRDGRPVAFIDWDGAWISDPLWDVGYAMWQFAPLSPDTVVRAAGWPAIPDRLARAVALADGYGLDRAGRVAIPGRVAPMIRACAASIEAKARAGQEAFSRLVEADVLTALDQEASYAAGQEAALRRALLDGR
jgi:Phosphotransferase enzyme family